VANTFVGPPLGALLVAPTSPTTWWRVNSVDGFFGWGMMLVGTALGGIVVWLTDLFVSRPLAPADALLRGRPRPPRVVPRRRPEAHDRQGRSGAGGGC
jgi:hypothetical protein